MYHLPADYQHPSHDHTDLTWIRPLKAPDREDHHQVHGLKLRKTDILKIIDEALAKLPHRDDIKVAMTVSLDDPVVWVDHELMVSAFLDLSQNAFEAMEGGGILTVTITGNDQQVQIDLADTGTGITEENMNLLFTPFFTTKPIGDGTGLGLATAYATMKIHGGTLSVDSNADPRKGVTGTTVSLSFPRRMIFQGEKARLIVHDDD